jgi:hypothetical protein
MQTIARLHNFCLTKNNDYNEMMKGVVWTPGQEEVGLEMNGDKPAPTPGVLYLRELLVKRVKEAGLSSIMKGMSMSRHPSLCNMFL